MILAILFVFVFSLSAEAQDDGHDDLIISEAITDTLPDWSRDFQKAEISNRKVCNQRDNR